MSADDFWSGSSWRDAAIAYHKERGDRVSLVEYKPAELARLRKLLDRRVSLERARAQIQAHRERQRGAAASTIEALLFELRGGLNALKHSSNQRRLRELNDEQMTEVAACLRQRLPQIGKAWTADETQQLISKWEELHRD